MKRITKIMLFYWKYWAGILLLLGLQLYCLTGFSGHMYNIKHTGGDNSGIRYMIAEKMSASSWEWTALYLTDAEKAEWNSCYEMQEDGSYKLLSSYMESATLESLEKKFLEPQAVVYYISQMSDEELQALLDEHGTYFTTDYLDVRDIVADEIDKEGNDAMYDYAREQVLTVSGKAGINLKNVKSSYILGQVFWIIFRLLMTAASIVGIYYVQQQLVRIFDRRIEEREVARAIKMLYGFLAGLFLALAWYNAAIWQLKERGMSMRTVKISVVLLILLAVAVILIRRMNVTEWINDRFGYRGKNQRVWLNVFLNGILAGAPAAEFVTAFFVLIHRSLTAFALMLLADALLAVIGFGAVDLYAAVDGVDKIEKNAIAGEDI